MMNPEIVTGISLMLLFVFISNHIFRTQDVQLGFGTLLISHVTFNLPYVILSVSPKIRQLDKFLPEAAQDLGCTPTKAFFKVVIPQIRPGIVAGFLMAFTLSFDDFVISYYTTGSSFKTLPVYIYNMVRKPVTPEIYALYSIILAGILVLLIIYNFVSAKSPSTGKKR
jgi:spermidine/putrescine transport system permease protein